MESQLIWGCLFNKQRQSCVLLTCLVNVSLSSDLKSICNVSNFPVFFALVERCSLLPSFFEWFFIRNVQDKSSVVQNRQLSQCCQYYGEFSPLQCEHQQTCWCFTNNRQVKKWPVLEVVRLCKLSKRLDLIECFNYLAVTVTGFNGFVFMWQQRFVVVFFFLIETKNWTEINIQVLGDKCQIFLVSPYVTF